MAEETLIAGNTEATGDTTPAATPAADAAPAADATTQQSAEGQTTEAGTTDSAASTEGDKAAQPTTLGAPETYEFKAPEGGAFDDEVIGELSAVAKELDLSQGAAQTLVDRLAPKIAERTLAAQQEAMTAVRAEWTNSSKADKEFGGEALNQNLSVAKKALDTFGTPELRTLLNETGLGNHPEIIRAFYRAGKQISEDTFVAGSTRPAAGGKDAASTLYGSQKH